MSVIYIFPKFFGATTVHKQLEIVHVRISGKIRGQFMPRPELKLAKRAHVFVLRNILRISPPRIAANSE